MHAPIQGTHRFLAPMVPIQQLQETHASIARQENSVRMSERSKATHAQLASIQKAVKYQHANLAQLAILAQLVLAHLLFALLDNIAMAMQHLVPHVLLATIALTQPKILSCARKESTH